MINVGPLLLDDITEDELLEKIFSSSLREHALTVVTPNVAHLYEATKSDYVASSIKDADVSIPDGWPIARLMSKISGKPHSRITGSDLSIRVLEGANKTSKSVMFLGGSDVSLEQATRAVEEKYKNIEVRRPAHNPHLPAKPTPESVDTILKIINSAEPDIVFFCFGAPKSELHVYEAHNKIQAGVVLCVGATVDFISGQRKRAPKLLQNMRLEWLYRFLQEPRRLFLRYWTGGITYLRYELRLLKTNLTD